MRNNKAIVIGGGIAGLASALRINKLGYKVTVLEASNTIGGKLRQFEVQGYRFDKGPSLFTLPHLMEELFELYDKDIADYFEYEQSEIACQYFFSDSSSFTAHANPSVFAENIKEKWGLDTDKTIHEIIDDYKKVAPIFLESSLTKPSDLLSKEVVKALPVLSRLGWFESLHDFNEKHFKDPQLIQLFDRYATYNGSTPYKTPSIMRVISALEHADGVYFPKNGMRSIATSLYQLAKEEGVEFRTNEKVNKVNFVGDHINQVITEGNTYNADLVVSNADVNFFVPEVLNKKINIPKEKDLSSSALVFYWGVKKSYPQLHLHNILFSEDYKKEFEELFEELKIPSDPTIYIHISSKMNKNDAPDNSENWFVMINVPPRPSLFDKETVQKVEEKLITYISKILDSNLKEEIEYTSYWTPKEIETDTLSWKGALYGLNSNKLTSALYRQRNKSNKYKNLYFVGGSVHPGGGIPLCLNSAKIVGELIK